MFCHCGSWRAGTIPHERRHWYTTAFCFTEHHTGSAHHMQHDPPRQLQLQLQLLGQQRRGELQPESWKM